MATIKGKRILEIHIEHSGIASEVLTSLLGDCAMKVKTMLQEAEESIDLELREFTYSILGDGEEEQAVASAEIWGIQNEELDDLMHDVAAGHASAINNGSVEDQVRFLCRQLGGVGVIKALKEITEKRKDDH